MFRPIEIPFARLAPRFAASIIPGPPPEQRINRFDFSGNGESEGTFEDSTYHKEVEDLKEVMQYFKNKGVKEFCLVGHSMGGAVAIELASKRTNLVGQLILAEANLWAGGGDFFDSGGCAYALLSVGAG